ncbi:MAG: PaaI family thioesterase [Actinomycetota bacterium]|nr:PaaI family thioesterase [Actinomycetota bacterium]
MTEAFKPSWAEQLRQALRREVTPQRAAMRRLGDAMRLLTERLMATTAPLPAIEEAIDGIEAVERRLDAYPTGRVPEGFSETSTSGDPHAFFDNSPLVGRANPLAPPVVAEIENNCVVGRVRFGAAYEGAPGCVHGGFVAAALDEVLGMAQSLTGNPGMTGTITVKYRKPTPLYADLRFEGWVDRVEGRKIFTVGRVLHEGELTAEADAVFIRVDFSKIAELYDRRRRPR